MEQLCLDKGRWAGRPMQLLPWQTEFIQGLFALDRRGRRKVKRALQGVARKNGKSGWGAALALTMLVCDGERGAEVVGAAAKRDQARLILETAKRMVKYTRIQGRPLSDFLQVRRDAIYYPELDSRYIVVSADGEKEHGLNPSTVIVDEWHALGTKRDLIDALITAQGARENPLLIGLTTAGPAPKGSCFEEYTYLRRWEQGIINDPEFFGVWFEADRELDVTDERGWEQANPSIDAIVSRDWLRKAAADVVAGRMPEFTFRRLHLNQWTSALERWLQRNKWEKCGELPVHMPEGATITIALDAALRRDSFGVAWVHRSQAWAENEAGLSVPADIANLKVRAFVPEHDGDYIDLEEVRTFVMGLCARFHVDKVLYDPAYMTLFAQQLGEAGIPVEPFPQSGDKMVMASETFQRLVLSARLAHGNDRTLDEQLAGVAVSETDRGVRVSKRKSADRIDTVVAAMMACAHVFEDEDDEDEGPIAFIP